MWVATSCEPCWEFSLPTLPVPVRVPVGARSKVSARMMEGADSWRRLHDTTHQTAKEKKIAQIKQQMEEDELRQCSFKPNINRKSKVLMKVPARFQSLASLPTRAASPRV